MKISSPQSRLKEFFRQWGTDWISLRRLVFYTTLSVSAVAALLDALGGQDVMFKPEDVKTVRMAMLVWAIAHIPMYLAARGRNPQKIYLIYAYAAFGVVTFLFQTCNVDPALQISTQTGQNCALIFLGVLLLPRRRFIEYSFVVSGTSLAYIAYSRDYLLVPRGTAYLMALTSIIAGFWILSVFLSFLLDMFHQRMAESHQALSSHSAALAIEVEKQAQIIQLQKEAAFEAQKMEAIGLLAGGIAHDFNNKLAVIKGYSEIIGHDLEKLGYPPGNLGHIIKAVNDTTNMTRQLLSFSRKEIVQPRVVDINAELNERRVMLSLLAGGQASFSLKLSPDACNTLIDPAQFEQILVNLVANARDAMPDGGSLEISTFSRVLDRKTAENIPGAAPGTYIVARFTDTGTGIDPQTMSRLFEPFFTTKPRGRGTGLGLATTYGNVKQNGGFIEVASTVNEGSVFSIHLPRAGGSPDAGTAAIVQVPDFTTNKTILVVEDDTEVRDLLVKILSSSGFRTINAPGPAEAIQVSRDHQGTIHLMLCDVIMLDGGALTAVTGIRAQRPGIRILYMSGYPDEVLAPKGILSMGKNFIAKPFDSPTLLKKIGEVLSASS